MSKDNSNLPINTYKPISIDKEDNTQTILLQKRRHQIFRIIPSTK